MELQTNEFQAMPTHDEANGLLVIEEGKSTGVFWCVPASADSGSTDHELRAKCIALGIQVPQFRKMDPYARRRLPPNPDKDSYKPLSQRFSDNDWHKNHGRPRHRQELNEDAHFLLRCLHWRLPLHLITKPTRTSTEVDRFVRQYGAKFATFAEEQNAVHMVEDAPRIRSDMILQVARSWLSSKVNDQVNTFQWEGFVMTSADISRTTEKACAEWLAGYM